MTWPDRDKFNRTAKQLIDSGKASNHDEAVAILKSFVLQIRVGPGVDQNPAAQAALLTAVNAGSRAFLGGVNVQLDDNVVLTKGWGAGESLTTAIVHFGGRIVDHLDNVHPTLIVGRPGTVVSGEITLYVTSTGWVGGIVENENNRLRGCSISLAGVLAGALGVSECFQYCLGSPFAGRRDVGASLWRPDLNWRDAEAIGPELNRLPTRLWLLGLGHLGQANAWSLGFLPYKSPSDAHFYMMDDDVLVEGNLSTGLLANSSGINQQKTRVVARQLEKIGFKTSIVERRYDKNTIPTALEPEIALAGFDKPEPRRLLGNGFKHVVDVGLGSGPVDYLDILIHTFPSILDPMTQFREQPPSNLHASSAPYMDEAKRLIELGQNSGDATCGMIAVAGITVGAAFVGAIAGAFAIADMLRLMNGGQNFSVLSLDLRSPQFLQAHSNQLTQTPFNPGFTSNLISESKS